MKDFFLITMYVGGGDTKKWLSEEEPTLLPQGTGVEFVSVDTKLKVRAVGNISVEQYQSGRMGDDLRTTAEGAPAEPMPTRDDVKPSDDQASGDTFEL